MQNQTEENMTIEIKVPPLPESVTDATLVGWHKNTGESVSRDENLVDLETDKVVLEVPSPVDGVLEQISANDGDTGSEEFIYHVKIPFLRLSHQRRIKI